MEEGGWLAEAGRASVGRGRQRAVWAQAADSHPCRPPRGSGLSDSCRPGDRPRDRLGRDPQLHAPTDRQGHAVTRLPVAPSRALPSPQGLAVSVQCFGAELPLLHPPPPRLWAAVHTCSTIPATWKAGSWSLGAQAPCATASPGGPEASLGVTEGRGASRNPGGGPALPHHNRPEFCAKHLLLVARGTSGGHLRGPRPSSVPSVTWVRRLLPAGPPPLAASQLRGPAAGVLPLRCLPCSRSWRTESRPLQRHGEEQLGQRWGRGGRGTEAGFERPGGSCGRKMQGPRMKSLGTVGWTPFSGPSGPLADRTGHAPSGLGAVPLSEAPQARLRPAVEGGGAAVPDLA